MKLPKRNIVGIMVMLTLSACTGQTNRSQPQNKSNIIVGGGCDGCEIMYHGMPLKLTPVDTSAGWRSNGQKLIVDGTAFKLDGKTPATDVIVYYWQTDHTGLYSKSKTENTIHGQMRGWVKTGKDGKFKIYTIRPASYPQSTIPAHIHFSIKEPNVGNEYYIDDLLFEDDPFLTANERTRVQERGGNGIGKIAKNGDIQYVRRDIILGKNITDYPK